MIDAHIHLWSGDRTLHPPMPYPVPLPDFDATIETLLTTMDAHGVAAAVAVQTPWFAHDDRYLVECVRRAPGRIVAVGCILEPWRARAPTQLRRQAEELGMRGARLHLTEDVALAAASGGGLDTLLETARSLRVPLCLLYRSPRGHEAAGVLARRFPDVPLVIDHMGHVGPQSDDPGDGLLALAEHPLVHVKLSLHHRLSAAGHPWEDLVDIQRRLLSRFGAQRLMWGSNFPMHLPSPDFEARLGVVRDASWLGPSDREWVLGRTADTLWPRLAP